MNSVIINIGIIWYILNSKYKIISMYLIMRFMNNLIISIGLLWYILNIKKYRIISIYSITRFHEQRDYIYWTTTIYFEFKKLNYFNMFNNAVPWMNSMIINIGLLWYILNSKYEIISTYLITQFLEQRDYRYWTYMIYFEFKI